MEWSNEVVLEFLDLYENEFVIWYVKHSEHKNRNAVNDAWKRIQDKISVECSIKELKKKKESLMSTFRPLSNKVKATSGTGSGADEVYKPTWFAYEKMAGFLQGICKPRNTQNTEELDVTADDENEILEEASQDVFGDASTEINIPTDTGSANAEEDPSNYSAKKQFKSPANKENRKRKAVDVVQERMDEAYKILKTSVSSEKSTISRTSLYGQLVAQKLEALDEVERAIAMNEIDNLLFRATMRHMDQRSHNLSRSNNTTPEQYPSYGNQQHAYPFSAVNHSSPANSYTSQPSPGQNILQPSPNEYENQYQAASPSITTMEPAKSQNRQPDTFIPVPQFSPF